MDYEKKYKDALERAREYHKVDYDNTMKLYAKGTMEYLFPELKESEGERIRKELLEHCKNQAKPYIQTGNKCHQIQSWIDWLEKQSEQKPDDKVEPKFKVGDVMRTLQEATNNITSGLPVVISIDEEYYHCTNELITIKDQDDYEYPPMNRRHNSAWSEDDETNLTQLHKLIVEKACREYEIETDDETLYGKWLKLDNWLKSLKPQLQWKPSEEQIKDFGGALLILKLQHYASSESLESLYEQLKKL